MVLPNKFNPMPVLLELTPFSKSENKAEWEMSEFTECGINLRFLSEKSKREKPSNGNLYAFGIVSDAGQRFWFFKGLDVAGSRDEARQVFLGLCGRQHSVQGKVFIYKVKRQ